MSLLAVSPALGEFLDYRAFVQADQKKVVELPDVQIIEVFL